MATTELAASKESDKTLKHVLRNLCEISGPEFPKLKLAGKETAVTGAGTTVGYSASCRLFGPDHKRTVYPLAVLQAPARYARAGRAREALGSNPAAAG